MSSTDGLAPEQVRHLEVVQSNVATFVGRSFATRVAAVVVSAGAIAVAAAEREPAVLLAALAASVFLWGLDAACMRSASLYEDLYEQLSNGDAAMVRVSDQWAIPWATFWSDMRLLSFYGPLMMVTVVVALLAA